MLSFRRPAPFCSACDEEQYREISGVIVVLQLLANPETVGFRHHGIEQHQSRLLLVGHGYSVLTALRIQERMPLAPDDRLKLE